MMREMRIAILHYTLPPVIGGVERVIRDQAGALQKLGHEVECFADRVGFRDWLETAVVERGCPHPQATSIKQRPASEDTRAPQRRVSHWLNHEDSSPYFEPAKDVSKHRHGRPHWQQDGKLFFVTWRLGDALPQEKLRELREAR
jgi:glycosyltransferase involved in cell wall biosynthesis